MLFRWKFIFGPKSLLLHPKWCHFSWSGILSAWQRPYFQVSTSVADPDTGSGIRCLFDPWTGSGIWNRFFPDPGSRISDPGSQTHIFESLVTNFWVKISIILWKLAQIIFLQHFKNKIIFNFVKFVATKKVWQRIFCHPSLLLLFLDPGSGMCKNQDPGSGIRDKHPGFATLVFPQGFCLSWKSRLPVTPPGQDNGLIGVECQPDSRHYSSPSSLPKVMNNKNGYNVAACF